MSGEPSGTRSITHAAPEKREGASRRRFIATAGGLAAGAALVKLTGGGVTAKAQDAAPEAPKPPPGVNEKTIAEAEKLAKVTFTDAERKQILETISDPMELIDALREADLANAEGPAEVFDPRLPGRTFPTEHRRAKFAKVHAGPLPSSEEDIAFAPLSSLSKWVHAGQISSERLTRLYLDRLKRFGPKLECTITLMERQAMERARRADQELAAGRSRGPLHGLPWGAKDLFDTKGVKTTWGAAPYKDRVPGSDATLVKKLDDAGAVLVAKLTMGALAYGDIWFGGKTRNPWNTEQGSSGSSAGPAAATAAGLVAFGIGTETYGSIASPSARCGATGFRPSFGRVSRAGAMALCWSLDKVGPICRTAGDCAMALDAIDGADVEDPGTKGVPLNLDMTASMEGVRVGYLKEAFESKAADDADHAVLSALRKLGATLVPVDLPQAPYGGVIFLLISVEAAAAFDTLTRENLDDLMKWQDAPAWPNTFRMTRLGSAVDYMQATRLRGRFMKMADELFADVDIVIAPRRHGALHALTNMTGQPALTIREGFRDKDGTPFAVTMWGSLYDDATLLRVGAALEKELDLWGKRPTLV